MVKVYRQGQFKWMGFCYTLIFNTFYRQKQTVKFHFEICQEVTNLCDGVKVTIREG